MTQHDADGNEQSHIDRAIEEATRCQPQGHSTRAVHGGTKRKKAFSSLTTPIVQSATFTFTDTQDLCDFMDRKVWGEGLDREEYGRYGNPTVWAVEERLAALDGGEDAALYSSGMAAVAEARDKPELASAAVELAADRVRWPGPPPMPPTCRAPRSPPRRFGSNAQHPSRCRRSAGTGSPATCRRPATPRPRCRACHRPKTGCDRGAQQRPAR